MNLHLFFLFSSIDFIFTRRKLMFADLEYMFMDDKLMFSVRKHNFSRCKDTSFF